MEQQPMNNMEHMMNMNQNQSCCDVFPHGVIALGMAYVPPQKWEKIYDPQVGFSRGTIFEALDMPFIGEEVTPRE